MSKLAVEPIGDHYRIVVKDTGSVTRPIIYASDLPLETMEEICQVMENRYHQVYEEGYAEGYNQGYDDGLIDSEK